MVYIDTRIKACRLVYAVFRDNCDVVRRQASRLAKKVIIGVCRACDAKGRLSDAATGRL